MKRFLRFILYINIFLVCITSISLAAFDDISMHWAERDIASFEEKGFVKGNGDGTFSPNAYIKRVELATIINAYMGYNVDDGDWQEANLAIAKDKSYMDTRNALSTVSREEAAVIFSKLFKISQETVTEETFKDEETIGIWAYTAVKSLANAGYIKGYESGEFMPGQSITRAEVVTILSRYQKPIDGVREPLEAEFSIGYLTSANGVVNFNKIDKEVEIEKDNILALAFTLLEDEEEPVLSIKSGEEIIELDSESNLISANAVGEAVISIKTNKRIEEIKIIIK